MGAKQARFVVLVALLLAATGCIGFRGVRVGDLQTRSETVELADVGSVDVEIQMSAGQLEVAGGAGDLLEASFTYNVEEMDPQATYSGGRLVVKDSDVDEGVSSLFDLGEFRNEWDLKLNEDVPMQMTIDLGAGPADLALGTLNLTNLDINAGAGNVDLDLSGSQSLDRLDFEAGAGEVTIDLTGGWQHDLDARIAGGLGNINVRVPRDVGVSIEVKTGVGSVDANGLTKDGNTYVNDAYGTSDATLRIDIEAGVGRINLNVE